MQRSTLISMQTAEAVLVGALAALREGSLGDYLRQRPGATRWFARRHLRVVLGTAGDRLGADPSHGRAAAMLVRWSAARLRPDHAALDAPIDDVAWLERTSWRPFLALACQSGMLAVPRFDARYRRSADESVAENLCGLWNVGTSTFYRYLDKARRMLAEDLLRPPAGGEDCLSLREAVHAELARERASAPADAAAWHRAEAARAAGRRDACAALWHALCAADVDLFLQLFQRYRIELASAGETDALLGRLAVLAPTPRQRFDLHLAEAALWRVRGAGERESRAYEAALRQAAQAGDKLLLGIVYGAIGTFHESRDTDRALACFEESADFLRRAEAEAGPAGAAEVASEYVAALVRLAWLYGLRNDPRARAVLEVAEPRRGTAGLSLEVVAMLDQAWGEYWRRAGEPRLAISFRQKALLAFERLGDTRQTLSAHNNLSLLYLEVKDYERAIAYAQRIVAMAEGGAAVDPYILSSALGNMGIALFWLERLDEAIATYGRGLAVAREAGLRVIVMRAHYNLAEAHFKRFQLRGDPSDEAAGDRHLAAVRDAPATERTDSLAQAASGLKSEILGAAAVMAPDRLLSAESAAHFEEMREVQRQRAILAVPGTPAEHVRAHLAIANAYLAISGKEREEALALIQRHELGGQFEAEIDRLGVTFSRGLTREKTLLAQWRQKCYGVLTEERISPVLRQVMSSGSINKSGYAQLCQVGLATASKHLGTLAERGLLVQLGKGPSTRYVLPN
jgi:tetratricopeptide (TPR) repeat protein